MTSNEIQHIYHTFQDSIRLAYSDRLLDRNVVMDRLVKNTKALQWDSTVLLYQILRQAQKDMFDVGERAIYWFFLFGTMIVPDSEISQQLKYMPNPVFYQDPDLWQHICQTLYSIENPKLEWLCFEHIVITCPSFEQLIRPEYWNVWEYLCQYLPMENVDNPLIQQVSQALEDGLLQLSESLLEGKSGQIASDPRGSLLMIVREWYVDLEFTIRMLEEDYGMRYPVSVEQSIQYIIGFFLEAVLGECYVQANNPYFHSFYLGLIQFYFQHFFI